MSDDDMKQELDARLSELIHEFEERGLSHDDISDSLFWHYELEESRSETILTELSD